MAAAKRFLVIEPDEGTARRISEVLTRAGAVARVSPDAESGWKTFAADPPHMVLTALSTPKKDGAWFIRRLRDEYLGAQPQMIAIVGEHELGRAVSELEVDGVLLRPIATAALVDLARAPISVEAPEQQLARLRGLFELSLLGDESLGGAKGLVDRVAQHFRVTDCVLWGPPHEPGWPVSHRGPLRADQQALLMWRCDLALASGSTLLAPNGLVRADAALADAPAASAYLAAPLDAPGARSLGALCLIDDAPRRFSPEEREALRLLARRLAVELAWHAAHARVVADHERLRETALVDPALGVLVRAPFLDTLHEELPRAQRAHEGVVLAIVDVEQLRQINERYGHVIGDAALRHVAELIRRTMRPTDIVGRVAGDEIAIAILGASTDEAHALLDRLRQAAQDVPMVHHGLELPIQITIGGVPLGDGEPTPEALIARASAALRQAKRQRARLLLVADVTGATEPGVQGDAPADVMPTGTTLGGMYRILHEISRGAMGVVYRGEDLGLSRPVAIKVLRQDLTRDPDVVARFREEAAMLAQLRHEHLVQVFAFGAQEDDVYFVMELVEGEPLSAVLTRMDEAGEELPVAQIESIVSQIASALEAMHRAGAIHRDVKPANILLDRVRDRAVLVDVGVAKRSGGGSVTAAGTPGFAAPESFTGGAEVPATDVYGLAATAYMMLTGLAPFGGGDVAKVVRRQLQDIAAPVTMLRKDVSRAVDKVMARALMAQPPDRYGRAEEFSTTLGAALSESVAGDPHATMPGNFGATAATMMGEASSRGALYRVAYKILGNRLGSAWVRRATEEHPDLGEVLRAQLHPLGWYPTARLVTLLGAVPTGVRDPRKVARELGRAAMTATFGRFLGADPTALGAERLLGIEAPGLWRRYHTWGDLASAAGPGRATVTLRGTPQKELLCTYVEGCLERIAELAGADGVQTVHSVCEARGQGECVFELSWNEPGYR